MRFKVLHESVKSELVLTKYKKLLSELGSLCQEKDINKTHQKNIDTVKKNLKELETKMDDHGITYKNLWKELDFKYSECK